MRRIGDDVAHELTRLGPQGAIGAVVDAWPPAVGETIARNAWPARIGRDRTLHVSTASSAWAFELSQLAPDILARLRAALGDAAPHALRFAPGRLPEPPAAAPAAERSSAREPSPAERDLAERLTALIADEELRALVARAAAASLARSSKSPAARDGSDRQF